MIAESFDIVKVGKYGQKMNRRMVLVVNPPEQQMLQFLDGNGDVKRKYRPGELTTIERREDR
jgi:hypothetical protein